MSKDHKELGKFILVLLILLASLIIVNNNMFPSMRNSDGDNSAYDMLVGNANQYFDDEEEDNGRFSPAYKDMDDDKLIEIRKNVH